MPAGNYVINREMGSDFITVRNLQTGTAVQALVRPESPSKKTEKLIFHHYGSQYIPVSYTHLDVYKRQTIHSVSEGFVAVIQPVLVKQTILCTFGRTAPGAVAHHAKA